MVRISIKIYGERHTGTNYLQGLVERNLEADCLRGKVPKWWRRLLGRSEASKDRYFRWSGGRNLGWKHAMPPSLDEIRRTRAFSDRLLILTLTKNPYSWLLSLHRRPYHVQHEAIDLEQLVVSPWPTVGRENHDMQFKNPIDMWNRKNASYHAMRDEVSWVTLRYEDLVADPAETIREIATQFSVRRKSTKFRNLEQAAKTKDKSPKDFSWYRDYYGRERWREELPARVIELVNAELDPAVTEAYGYSILEPREPRYAAKQA